MLNRKSVSSSPSATLKWNTKKNQCKSRILLFRNRGKKHILKAAQSINHKDLNWNGSLSWPQTLSFRTLVTMSWPTSGPEFCVVWLRKMPASEWGSLWESSSFVPWFSTFVFRNVLGTVPECVRICGFKRKSSNLDRVPKMRDYVLLNSWDIFLGTLSSISSETCVIYSSLNPGTDVFRDWPFLGCSSCVSLERAANFRLFLNVAIFWRGNATQLWRLN